MIENTHQNKALIFLSPPAREYSSPFLANGWVRKPGAFPANTIINNSSRTSPTKTKKVFLLLFLLKKKKDFTSEI